jgi:GrpB-like predicted nucleotidyltransferase (UPF0157 family)
MNKDLNQFSIDELGKLFPIVISNPNPKWGKIFKQEKEKIISILGMDIIDQIEHIGSTAVPNLKAKPTIDILLIIKNNVNLEKIILQLGNLGYHYISKQENPPPHMMFAKGYSKNGYVGQAFHIHIRYKGDWDEIYFRDYLLKNPDVAKEYEKLKLKLAKRHKHNREEYTEAKTDFIKKINKLARKK